MKRGIVVEELHVIMLRPSANHKPVARSRNKPPTNQVTVECFPECERRSTEKNRSLSMVVCVSTYSLVQEHPFSAKRPTQYPQDVDSYGQAMLCTIYSTGYRIRHPHLGHGSKPYCSAMLREVSTLCHHFVLGRAMNRGCFLIFSLFRT